MIAAWEAIGLIPKIDETTELKVRLVKLTTPRDAFGLNIVGVVHISDNADAHLVDEIQRRIRATVGRLD